MFSTLSTRPSLGMRFSSRARRFGGRCLLVAAAWGMAACHGLLDVSDPTLIRDQDIANVDGANGRRLEAYAQFAFSLGQTFRDVAFFSDELSYDRSLQSGTARDEIALNARDRAAYLAMHLTDDIHLGRLDGAMTFSSIAIPAIRTYTPSPLKGDYLAQLFAYRGYVLLQMAEDICPGFPINDVTPEHVPIYGMPMTTDSAVGRAITQLDSAIADVQDSTQYRDMATVLKGRALLDLGRYADAAAVVHDVATDFVYQTDPHYGNVFYAQSIGNDPTWRSEAFPVGDHEWGTGLGFVSEHDTVRVPVAYRRQGFNDTSIAEYAAVKYSIRDQPITLVSGTEARLIEAEAALHANDGSWLTILNALRAPVGLEPLADPGTDSARVDLVYHERAFWMYLTGRRLGDLRRLIRNYGRSATSLFPAGPNRMMSAAPYGNSTSIAFSATDEGQFNPHITTGCTDQ